MGKDRKSINIMMIIIVLVSIIGIGANIFLLHNDKENSKNTIVGTAGKQYAVGIQENTIQAINDVTPEASIPEDDTQTQNTQEQDTQGEPEQDTQEQDTENGAEQATQEQDTENRAEEDTQEQHTKNEQDQDAQEIKGTYYIDGASSVNIRSDAYNQSKVVGWLAKGTEVEMINKGKYYSYIKHGNMEGYVYNEYISQK